MFDKKYFDDVLPQQVKTIGEATALVYLTTGRIFTIRTIDETFTGYACFQIFPPEGISEESKAARRKKFGSDEVFYDRLTVAYETICYIELTFTERTDHAIGFHALVGK